MRLGGQADRPFLDACVPFRAMPPAQMAGDHDRRDRVGFVLDRGFGRERELASRHQMTTLIHDNQKTDLHLHLAAGCGVSCVEHAKSPGRT